ncbi:hypothetical protein TMatcc_011218 [Talaromyces marneffei ATCC 18224]
MPPVNMRRITSLKSLIPAAFAPGSGFTKAHEGNMKPHVRGERSADRLIGYRRLPRSWKIRIMMICTKE